jgi:hypothetical protein
MWVLYALRRRLAERKPIIWYQMKRCYLFVEEGVYQAPADFNPGVFRSFIWTLVDSDEDTRGVPYHLVPHGTRMFVIYPTDPQKQRWSGLHNTVRTASVTMNPWTRGEISQV